MTHPRVKLLFPEHLVREPIIARMAREMGVMANIRRASVDETVGWMVCELDGDPGAVDDAVRWLEGLGIEVDRLSDVVEG
ncbi:MAG: FeS-binding protein [Acidimicrobiales bacterium]|nr:MAG: FeS-binding protein [Acidimicrobiales bacterium]